MSAEWLISSGRDKRLVSMATSGAHVNMPAVCPDKAWHYNAALIAGYLCQCLTLGSAALIPAHFGPNLERRREKNIPIFSLVIRKSLRYRVKVAYSSVDETSFFSPFFFFFGRGPSLWQHDNEGTLGHFLAGCHVLCPVFLKSFLPFFFLFVCLFVWIHWYQQSLSLCNRLSRAILWRRHNAFSLNGSVQFSVQRAVQCCITVEALDSSTGWVVFLLFQVPKRSVCI